MRLIDADALKKLRRCEIDEYADGWTFKELWEAEEADIDSLPAIDSAKNKLQRALDGKTEEEIYDFLSWLMFEYAKQYTDSRSAVIKWLKEDGAERRTDERSNQKTGGD